MDSIRQNPFAFCLFSHKQNRRTKPHGSSGDYGMPARATHLAIPCDAQDACLRESPCTKSPHYFRGCARRCTVCRRTQYRGALACMYRVREEWCLHGNSHRNHDRYKQFPFVFRLPTSLSEKPQFQRKSYIGHPMSSDSMNS